MMRGGATVSASEYWTRQGLLRELWRKTEGGYGYTKVGEYYRRPRSSRYFALRVRANDKPKTNQFDDWRRARAWVAER